MRLSKEFFLPRLDLIESVESLWFAEGYHYFPNAYLESDGDDWSYYYNQVTYRNNYPIIFPLLNTPLFANSVAFANHRRCRNDTFWRDLYPYALHGYKTNNPAYMLYQLQGFTYPPNDWAFSPHCLTMADFFRNLGWSYRGFGSNASKTCVILYQKIEFRGEKKPSSYYAIFWMIVKAFTEDCFVRLPVRCLVFGDYITLHHYDFSIFGIATKCEDQQVLKDYLLTFDPDKPDIFSVTLFQPPAFNVMTQNMRVIGQTPFFQPSRVILSLKVNFVTNKLHYFHDGLDYFALPIFRVRSLNSSSPVQDWLDALQVVTLEEGFWDNPEWVDPTNDRINLFNFPYHNAVAEFIPPTGGLISIKPILRSFEGHKALVWQTDINPRIVSEKYKIFYDSNLGEYLLTMYLRIRELGDKWFCPQTFVAIQSPIRVAKPIISDLGGVAFLSALDDFKVSYSGSQISNTQIYQTAINYSWDGLNKTTHDLKDKPRIYFKWGQEFVKFENLPSQWQQVDYDKGGKIVRWLYRKE